MVAQVLLNIIDALCRCRVIAREYSGFVHIAPGHGLDDYNLGRQMGLPIYSPVDDDGKLATNSDLPLEQQFGAELIGKSILEKGDGKSEANEAVLGILRQAYAIGQSGERKRIVLGGRKVKAVTD